MELHAKGSGDPNPIAKAQAYAQADGTAVFTLPIYRPQDKAEGEVEYFLVFKHALVPGIAFPKNTSFISPKAAAGFKSLEKTFLAWKEKYPKGRIVVFGHADAGESEPKALSERRAQSAFAFITNDAAAWERLYTLEKWGLASLQWLLKDLGHYADKVDGLDGPNTQKAFKAFQNRAGLLETGSEDAATRKALFAAYMAGKHDIRIDESRFRQVAGHPWMGCATNNAVKAGSPAPENRRVVFILLNESRAFPIHFYCRDGDESACQRQCRREGRRSDPAIKCYFHDELVREEKQAPGEEEALPRPGIPWMAFAEREARRWKGKTEEADSFRRQPVGPDQFHGLS